MGKNNFCLKFREVQTSNTKDCTMIEGEFTIYTDEKDNKKFWAIFKRFQGDQFLFKELFEKIRSHH